ncbi:hypothetical protein [Micromonospora echinofusca]|uniref:Uncharacterized protein n=1 Tax=Micromonospora echinofusca TaxID=47858 RepID=A0ABS3VYW2_MICEH|nr:hypothetical protein [Micromonospora echinofusca]MBO4209666.1 hypothetical protein [Micromonospora echinofusca]
MIADWLVVAAGAGGSALVGAAATDVWAAARTGVVRLFGRGGERRQELAGRWADETAAAVAGTPESERDAVRQQWAQTWQQRLIDLLDEYPEAADDLRAWTEAVRAGLPESQRAWVNTFVARDNAIQYNAPGGTMNIVNNPGPRSS